MKNSHQPPLSLTNSKLTQQIEIAAWDWAYKNSIPVKIAQNAFARGAAIALNFSREKIHELTIDVKKQRQNLDKPQ
jgi:hypothetical protein